MKSPKMPDVTPAPVAPLPPPPVSVSGREASQAANAAKLRARAGYSYDKTILRPGGLSSLPTGTSPTLGS